MKFNYLLFLSAFIFFVSCQKKEIKEEINLPDDSSIEVINTTDQENSVSSRAASAGINRIEFLGTATGLSLNQLFYVQTNLSDIYHNGGFRMRKNCLYLPINVSDFYYDDNDSANDSFSWVLNDDNTYDVELKFEYAYPDYGEIGEDDPIYNFWPGTIYLESYPHPTDCTFGFFKFKDHTQDLHEVTISLTPLITNFIRCEPMCDSGHEIEEEEG